MHYAAELANSQTHSPRENIEIIIVLIESGGDVNISTHATNETPIHYCAKFGNYEVAKGMFECLGPARTLTAINRPSKNGSSGLIMASEQGNLDTVKVFLAFNARVDVFEEQGRASLHMAAEYGHYEVAEELIKFRAYVGAKTKLGFTPLHYAAQNGHARLTIFIVNKNKTAMEALTLARQTPLHLAAKNGQKAVVSVLLRMKANADAKDSDEKTPLHLATENDHSDVVSMFLKFRPEFVTAANNDGMTCAHLAASKGRTTVVEELMRFNQEAVLTAKNKINESTPLQLAVIGGHVDVVKTLIKAGASASEENTDGMSALLLAAQHGHLKILDVLKDSVPLDTVSKKTGFSALHVAAKYGQHEFVQELLNHVSHDLLTCQPQMNIMKVLLDVDSDYGLTALHLAAEFGQENVVRMLLNSTRIMSDTKTIHRGSTALHLAAANGHVDIASLLLSKLSILISSKDKKGKLPLHLAATNGKLNMVTLLLGQGSEIDAHDKDGWTSLHCASNAGHLNVVQQLVTSGASTKYVTIDGKLPASLASAAGHNDVLSFLMTQNLDTKRFLEDNKFAFDLMELGKLNDQMPITEFVLSSKVPAETSARLSKIFRQLGLKEKERSIDFEKAAVFSEELALQLTSIANTIVHADELLNAIDDNEMTFLDLLIDCEQKEVIAHPTIQLYLSEVWTGAISEWGSWRMLLLFMSMLFCPPIWIILSLPLEIGLSKIPVVKFMSHLISHLYLIVLYILCTVYPSINLWQSTYTLPSWSEWLLLIWLSGLLVAQLTSNENISGLGWLRVILMGLSIIAVIVNLIAYILNDVNTRSSCIYIRNQLFAFAMLLAFVLMMEYLSFHYLFGPWAIIIKELMKDLLRFLVVLAIFIFGFTFQLSALFMPVYSNSNSTGNETTLVFCDNSTTCADSDETTLSQLGPQASFEIVFWALFGLLDFAQFPNSPSFPWWTTYLLKSIVGMYMLITFIMLVNLLIATMSDTYADIQAQSDVEWKFGRAQLFQNMNKSSSSPTPIVLITKLITYIAVLHKFRGTGCLYNTQALVNEIEGIDSGPGVANTSSVKDSSKGCCPCFKCCKKKTADPAPRKATPTSLTKLEKVVDWKLVTEKYMSMNKLENK